MYCISHTVVADQGAIKEAHNKSSRSKTSNNKKETTLKIKLAIYAARGVTPKTSL